MAVAPASGVGLASRPQYRCNENAHNKRKLSTSNILLDLHTAIIQIIHTAIAIHQIVFTESCGLQGKFYRFTQYGDTSLNSQSIRKKNSTLRRYVKATAWRGL
jgi:hypothetical protein